MTDEQQQNTDMPWRQSGFEEMISSWGFLNRRTEDNARLKEIFALAKNSPTMAAALDWAEKHGVKFFIDRTAVGCVGYYTPGTGVVGVAVKAIYEDRDAVGVITHEIRHAWQDYHGLIRRDHLGFTDYFVRGALIEADAMAFEKRAQSEFDLLNLDDSCDSPQGMEALLPTYYAQLEEEPEELRKNFLSFYTSFRPEFYGDSSSKHFGQYYGLYKGQQRNHCFEFTSGTKALGDGIDLSYDGNLIKLGDTFTGKNNYISGISQETMENKILKPSLVRSFYKAANNNQRKLVAQITKYERKQARRRAILSVEM